MRDTTALLTSPAAISRSSVMLWSLKNAECGVHITFGQSFKGPVVVVVEWVGCGGVVVRLWWWVGCGGYGGGGVFVVVGGLWWFMVVVEWLWWSDCSGLWL